MFLRGVQIFIICFGMFDKGWKGKGMMVLWYSNSFVANMQKMLPEVDLNLFNKRCKFLFGALT